MRNLAQHYLTHQEPNNADDWLKLKGIGPWTIDYAKMRGLSEPDIFLAGDLGIKHAIDNIESEFNSALASPWRSYLTFQLWSQL